MRSFIMFIDIFIYQFMLKLKFPDLTEYFSISTKFCSAISLSTSTQISISNSFFQLKNVLDIFLQTKYPNGRYFRAGLNLVDG